MLTFLASPHFLRWSLAATWLMTPYRWNLASIFVVCTCWQFVRRRVFLTVPSKRFLV